MKKIKSVMFVGTASDVGKSILTTGICRILKQDGFHPAPFKAQNMSLNSFVTPEGLEIGRAQAVQAEACGIPCHVDMNPVLLKPTSDTASQVVLHGKPVGSQSAHEYFMGNNKHELFREAIAAYDRLSARHNPIVLEGAGSISELNLKHRDIANMRMAAYADADTYLIADIDRGGVFGSVYGTIALLPKKEKKLIKGIIINKFRGDVGLFEDGRTQLEALTGVPVIGVVPYLKELRIEEEDAAALQLKNSRSAEARVNVAVILLKRLSNFTDFDALERDPRVHLFYSHDPSEILKADITILPGSKNTMGDLAEIKNNGIAGAVIQALKNGKTVIGICGGFQMMGSVICDPLCLEGDIASMSGLNIFPVRTTLQPEKVTQQKKFYYKGNPVLCEGYEIHMGISTAAPAQPLNILQDGSGDGYRLNGHCWGTYMHGILDNQVVIDDLVGKYTAALSEDRMDQASFKMQQYDLLAAHLRQHLDMAYIYRNLNCL
jgi:adenosylcobyric acid synthase